MINAIQLLAMGGVLWAFVWVLYTLVWTLLYGALAATTATCGLSLASCVDTPTLFTVSNVGMSPSGIAAILLMVAGFHFLRIFFDEFRIAYRKIINPFSRA